MLRKGQERQFRHRVLLRKRGQEESFLILSHPLYHVHLAQLACLAPRDGRPPVPLLVLVLLLVIVFWGVVLFSRIHEAAHEEDRARAVVADQEEERMVGTELGARRRVLGEHDPPVAAAASVPVSLTSTNALWMTAPTKRSFFPTFRRSRRAAG